MLKIERVKSRTYSISKVKPMPLRVMPAHVNNVFNVIDRHSDLTDLPFDVIKIIAGQE